MGWRDGTVYSPEDSDQKLWQDHQRKEVRKCTETNGYCLGTLQFTRVKYNVHKYCLWVGFHRVNNEPCELHVCYYNLYCTVRTYLNMECKLRNDVEGVRKMNYDYSVYTAQTYIIPLYTTTMNEKNCDY